MSDPGAMAQRHWKLAWKVFDDRTGEWTGTEIVLVALSSVPVTHGISTGTDDFVGIHWIGIHRCDAPLAAYENVIIAGLF